MSEMLTDRASPPAARRPLVSAVRDGRRPPALRWENALVVVALIAAALAIWLTLRAGYLAHPGWLAVQRADFILGPILVGLYDAVIWKSDLGPHLLDEIWVRSSQYSSQN